MMVNYYKLVIYIYGWRFPISVFVLPPVMNLFFWGDFPWNKLNKPSSDKGVASTFGKPHIERIEEANRLGEYHGYHGICTYTWQKSRGIYGNVLPIRGHQRMRNTIFSINEMEWVGQWDSHQSTWLRPMAICLLVCRVFGRSRSPGSISVITRIQLQHTHAYLRSISSRVTLLIGPPTEARMVGWSSPKNQPSEKNPIPRSPKPWWLHKVTPTDAKRDLADRKLGMFF